MKDRELKIELVKRFYVDSAPLIMDEKTLQDNEHILTIKPAEVISVNQSNQKQKKKIIYSYELNEQLDKCLLKLQVEMQKKRFYMPPSEDMGSAVGRMS